MDSIRQQIVDALVTRLEGILVNKGYETDLGLNIFEWRTTDFQESELPGCVVRDPDEETEVKGQYHYNKLNIEIEAKTKNSPVTALTTARESRKVIADITRAIGTDPTFGGLAIMTDPVDNESLDMEQKDRQFGSILMKLNILYRTKMFQPFSVA
jgi:hypothetical protein